MLLHELAEATGESAAPAARTEPVVVTAPPAQQGAVTAPLNASPAVEPAQQGFQPVSEGEIRTETLD